MKKIKFLRIQFQPEIAAAELPKFRGAVVEAISREHVLFHNHLDDGRLRYAYPLIQYKRLGGKPAMVCLNEGTDEIHALFQQRIRTLRLGAREIELSIQSIDLREWTLQAGKRLYPYRLVNWLALSPDNYRPYRDMPDESERLRFLSSILRGNLLAMAKGLGWYIEEEVRVVLHGVRGPRPVPYKDARLMAFDAAFSCNISLPGSIGLGKGAAKGHGVLYQAKGERREAQGENTSHTRIIER